MEDGASSIFFYWGIVQATFNIPDWKNVVYGWQIFLPPIRDASRANLEIVCRDDETIQHPRVVSTAVAGVAFHGVDQSELRRRERAGVVDDAPAERGQHHGRVRVSSYGLTQHWKRYPVVDVIPHSIEEVHQRL